MILLIPTIFKNLYVTTKPHISKFFYEICQQAVINLRTRYQEWYKLANMSKCVVHSITY
jgi:hypothetical protein